MHNVSRKVVLIKRNCIKLVIEYSFMDHFKPWNENNEDLKEKF